MLGWLEEELTKLEATGGFAWIIGHVDTNECLHEFGERLWSIYDRFQHVIRFSAYGHTHTEEFRAIKAVPVASQTGPAKAIGTQFVSGSITSWGNNNPAFTVTDFDAEFMVPLNTHTYFVNLTEANLHPERKPEWRLLHDFVAEYDVPDYSPTSLLDLT